MSPPVNEIRRLREEYSMVHPFFCQDTTYFNPPLTNQFSTVTYGFHHTVSHPRSRSLETRFSTTFRRFRRRIWAVSCFTEPSELTPSTRNRNNSRFSRTTVP